MMLEKIWVKADNRYQESFAVEMRSRTGFSGSPVYTYRMAYEGSLIKFNSPGLLGINWGYILDEDGENTWLNGVVPAWKVAEILESSEMKKKHEDLTDGVISGYKKATGGTAGVVQAFADDESSLSATDVESNSTNPTHREDFMRLVGAAARKPEREG